MNTCILKLSCLLHENMCCVMKSTFKNTANQVTKMYKLFIYSDVKIKWQAYERMEVILIYVCPVPKFLDSLRIMALIRQRHFVGSGLRRGGVGKSWRVKREHPLCSPPPPIVVPLDAFVTPSLILDAIGWASWRQEVYLHQNAHQTSIFQPFDTKLFCNK